jgi:nitrate reductase alpha subunit
VRYPYIRGARRAVPRRQAHASDPVEAWASIVEDPEKARAYKSARGKGGLVRTTWDEAMEIAAAAHVYTVKEYGPDRVAGFSPIPAMSMVSHGAGARFLNLVGGTILSFYDWYADLPVASPQVFGDQTDVPESADWWNAGYLMMWGSNVPVTRTPDAHFMAEARYRGQKVVTVSPDYTDNTKFADEWVAPHPGTDAALAMAMGHVILTEFFVQRRTAPFEDYMRRFSDAPYLVALEEHPSGLVPGKFLTASDLGGEDAAVPRADFKTVLLDQNGTPVVPNGSLGHRFTPEDEGRWNLDLEGVVPPLSLLDLDDTTESVEIVLPASTSRPAARTRRTPAGRAPSPAACPCAASPAASSRPCSTCCSRSTASRATDCRASGRPATTTRPRPARPPGRKSSRTCPRRRPRASAASSPTTPSARAAAR